MGVVTGLLVEESSEFRIWDVAKAFPYIKPYRHMEIQKYKESQIV